jgi:hypothetical protein
MRHKCIRLTRVLISPKLSFHHVTDDDSRSRRTGDSHAEEDGEFDDVDTYDDDGDAEAFGCTDTGGGFADMSRLTGESLAVDDNALLLRGIT